MKLPQFWRPCPPEIYCMQPTGHFKNIFRALKLRMWSCNNRQSCLLKLMSCWWYMHKRDHHYLISSIHNHSSIQDQNNHEASWQEAGGHHGRDASASQSTQSCTWAPMAGNFEASIILDHCVRKQDYIQETHANTRTCKVKTHGARGRNRAPIPGGDIPRITAKLQFPNENSLAL